MKTETGNRRFHEVIKSMVNVSCDLPVDSNDQYFDTLVSPRGSRILKIELEIFSAFAREYWYKYTRKATRFWTPVF